VKPLVRTGGSGSRGASGWRSVVVSMSKPLWRDRSDNKRVGKPDKRCCRKGEAEILQGMEILGVRIWAFSAAPLLAPQRRCHQRLDPSAERCGHAQRCEETKQPTSGLATTRQCSVLRHTAIHLSSLHLKPAASRSQPLFITNTFGSVLGKPVFGFLASWGYHQKPRLPHCAVVAVPARRKCGDSDAQRQCPSQTHP